MTLPDFWNLAGRAGRSGTEFRGNVVCIDTAPTNVWDSVPRERVSQRLVRASDEVMSKLGELRAFISAQSPAQAARDSPLTASVFSFLATRVAQGIPLASIPGIALSSGDCVDIENRIREALAGVELSGKLMVRHAGISPTAMQVLLEYFRGHANPVTLHLAMPESKSSELSYTKALSRSRDYLGASFGSDKRCAMLRILVPDWMRGYPLARLIAERMRIVRERDTEKDTDAAEIIRDTMDDVEQVARFSAPKYLACYLDIHNVFLVENRRAPLINTEALTMMLELSVSRPTEVSLMSLGLSRTSAVALSELIIADDLSREAALEWLRVPRVPTSGSTAGPPRNHSDA